MKKIIIGWIVLLLLIALAIIFFIWQDSFSFLSTTGDKWLATAVVVISALVLSHLHNLIFLMLNKVVKFNFKLRDKSHIDTDDKKLKKKPMVLFGDLQQFARERYGRLWRRKLTKCLVLGESADINKLLPDLETQQWQIGDTTLMVYGGSPQADIDNYKLSMLRKCCGRFWLLRRKPLDAIIWVLPSNYMTESRQQRAKLDNALLLMRERNRILGWEAPIYCVDGRDSQWSQEGRTEQGVGAFFANVTANSVQEMTEVVSELSVTSSERGMLQVMKDYHYSFLLQLAQDLATRDLPRLTQWFTLLTSRPKIPLLRGLLFTPTYEVEEQDNDLSLFDHQLSLRPTWQVISEDASQQSGRRVGLQWAEIACGVTLLFALCYGIGLSTSYYNNQALIGQSQQLVKPLANNKVSYQDRLEQQYQLQLQIGQLLHRQQESSPWSYRFGLNQNKELLTALWPYYYHINQQNIAEPFFYWSADYLNRLTAMSPADPNRVKWVDSGYNVLKAHLMLGLPEKTDANYLSEFASTMWAVPKNIDSGEWHKLMPELIKFWGEALVLHPDWAAKIDESLVKEVRQVLINQIGLQNAETTLYQAILRRAAQQYANQSLVQLLGGIDSRLLFSSNDELPGVYTRKAWENVVKDEISAVAKSRQEQIDWVLSDGTQSLSTISPEALRQNLTARYFSDYGAAWLLFLNNIEWRQAEGISDVIEQLTLLSDVRQSPLIALMNVIKYQAEVAYTGGGISDNLLRSAQDLIKDKAPTGLPTKAEASGPLTPTFLPLLSLLNADNPNGLSLQTYLLRVTQVRLKLQNMTASSNPQAVAQAMAKSVFQGTSIDLTETRDYGNLIAANLGEEWSGFGYSLFKQPLDMAWQVVLTPAAKSFNRVWQQQVLQPWETAFAGRYPFKESENDASLAELARFLRPDSGVIDKFIHQELSGVLQRQGDRWVLDPVHSQGLHFSNEFLASLELFNSLSNQLFAGGDAQMAFDLMARSGHKIVRSNLVIDKQPLDYFNQMPVWKRFNWPGEGYSPFAQLSWSTEDTGLQLYSHYAGDWGWVRLLEDASVRQIDSSRYELKWTLPVESELTYILRTQSGAGPLSLLQLRHFRLPNRIFEFQNTESIGLKL